MKHEHLVQQTNKQITGIVRPKPFHVFKPFVGSAKKIDKDTDRCPI